MRLWVLRSACLTFSHLIPDIKQVKYLTGFIEYFVKKYVFSVHILMEPFNRRQVLMSSATEVLFCRY